MQVKATQMPIEDAYLHIENGGLHVGLGLLVHEFPTGEVQKHLVLHAAQSQYGVRIDSAFRILNANHLQYLSEMIERAKQIFASDPAFQNAMAEIPVDVQLIDGLVVEKVFGPGEPVDGTDNLRESVIAHNYRNPATGEIVRTDAYNGAPIYRMVEPEGSHDGGGYDEEPETLHDAGSYGEAKPTIN